MSLNSRLTTLYLSPVSLAASSIPLAAARTIGSSRGYSLPFPFSLLFNTNRVRALLIRFFRRPPKKPMTDDVTGEPLIQRSDDNVETLRKRLASYHQQTAPVVDYYKAKKIWKPIDAAQSPPVVWESLVGVFKSAKKP